MINLNEDEFYELGKYLYHKRWNIETGENSQKEINNYLNFGKRMEYLAKKYPSKCAIVCEDEQISYSEFRKRYLRLSYYFKNQGFKKGDKFALHLENSEMFIIILFSLLELGIVPVLLLPAHEKKEIMGVVKKADVKAIIVDKRDASYEEIIDEVVRENINLEKVYISMELKNISLDENIDFTDFVSEEVDFNDTALLLLSGGTTGLPKLIARTQGDYIYNNEALARRLLLNEESVFLSILPLAHNFPLGAPGIMGTLLCGGKVVVGKYATPLEILYLIEKEKVTFVSLVPTVLNMCMQYRKIDDSDDLKSLEFIMVGGAVLPAKLSKNVDKLFGAKLIQIYGTAEGLCCCNFLQDDFETRISCQGKPCSPFDILKIVDENGNELPKGKEGELVTKGPYTIKSYYQLEEKQMEYFTSDGFYKTGDRVKIDKRGNVFVLGRAKEQINRAGEKIMPLEIEEALLTNEAIDECAIAGVKDELLGNRICAFVKANKNITLNDIKKYLKSKNMASFKMPDELILVDSMPYTAVKKIDKNKLIKIFEKRKPVFT
ncbi:yersiniabactin salicyl-AMP ligase [Acetitomaculum ruminis DSM 5522]|uniref:Yersiniabactin salicyl-AMP ligase n=1 Tax=Acetitomaculum ruminis DSM 5522 TaxID=1120918 RepID=A0A1I0X9H6_9FIRM|nr:AMP-binding protein [Acetitomaculum ruminis]SFA97337.1 yersiniabactin salicyl-AMP ligase [Acetitomaculum ruminis DSM 5522]